MSVKILTSLSTIAGLMVSTSALAQTGGGTDLLKGHEGASRPLPDGNFPQPTPAVPAGGPASGAAVAASGNYDDISVEEAASGAGQGAVDPFSFKDDGLGLSCSLAPGEKLDGAWVRRQFVANGLIGSGIGVDRAVALVQVINRALLHGGYVNSGLLVGEQVQQDGKIVQKLQLIAGRVTQVDVAWKSGHARGLSADFVRNRLPAARQRPFNAPVLEQQFRLLADDAAVRLVNVGLTPSTEPGEATVRVEVEPQQRVDLYAVAANSRSPAIGGERYSVGGSFRNALSGGDIVSAEYGNTAGHDDATLAYQTPLFSPNTNFMLRGVLNNAAVVEASLRPLDIRSKERVVEGGITQTLFARPLTPGIEPGSWLAAENLSVGVRVIHRRSITTLLGSRFSFSPGADNGRTEYTAVRFSVDGIRRSINSVLAGSLVLTSGLEGTRSSVGGVPTPDRQFKTVLGQVSYARRLTPQQLELRVRLAGQWADGLLYAGERFSVGGEYSVRGYRESLLLADKGLIGSIELTQPFSLTGKSLSSRENDIGAFALSLFVDGGLTGYEAITPVGPKSIASVGASLLWTPTPALSARITYGEALRHVTVAGKRDLQDKGFQFRVIFRPLSLFRN